MFIKKSDFNIIRGYLNLLKLHQAVVDLPPKGESAIYFLGSSLNYSRRDVRRRLWLPRGHG